MPFTTAALAFIAAAPMGLIPWLDPHEIIVNAGPWALLVVCLIVFAETGLLVGFILPGDTLLIITGLLSFTGTMTESGTGIQIPIWWVCIAIAVAAFLGGEVGYLIGHKAGPRIFEQKESGLFSKENVIRTNKFFERWGPLAIVIARFVPIVRTFAPFVAGIGQMRYRRFLAFNLIGAVLWVALILPIGYAFGNLPVIKKNFSIVIFAIIGISLLPAVIELLRERKARRVAA